MSNPRWKLDNLPNEWILQHLAAADVSSLHRFALVNNHMNVLLKTPSFWLNQIKQSFSPKEDFIQKMHPSVYKDVFYRLSLFRQNAPAKFKKFQRDILDTGMDFPPLTAKTIPSDLDPAFYDKYLIYALGMSNIPLAKSIDGFENNKMKVSYGLLRSVAEYGNLQSVRFLLEHSDYLLSFPKSPFGMRRLSNELNHIVQDFLSAGNYSAAFEMLADASLIHLKLLNAPAVHTSAHLAAYGGAFNILELIFKHCKMTGLENIFDAILMSGNVEAMIWLTVDQSGPLYQPIQDEEILVGHSIAAAESGNISFIEFFNKKYAIELSGKHLVSVIVSKKIDAVKWVMQSLEVKGQLFLADLLQAFETSLLSDNIDIVKLLYSKIIERSPDQTFPEINIQMKREYMNSAVKSGDVSLVEWVHSIFGIQPDSENVKTAVIMKNIAIIKRFVEANAGDPLRVLPTEEYITYVKEFSSADPFVVDLLKKSLEASRVSLHP